MELVQMLKALGEPTRFEIYCALLERKHCVRSLSRKMGITESAVSQHLKVMRESGLVYGEKYGHHTHYMPKQEAADFLAKEFEKMQKSSKRLCRDKSQCKCEMRKEKKNENPA